MYSYLKSSIHKQKLRYITVSNFNKSMIIYQSYIGLMTRQLRKRIKEHVPKSVRNN